MTDITDPARELADLCSKLAQENSAAGEVFLANQFNTTPWTLEFFEVLFAIVERIENLNTIIGELDMDQDIRQDASRHLSVIRSAFTPAGLNNQWRHAVVNFLNPSNIQPIKMLSSEVRKKYQLPKLSEEERTTLLLELDVFLGWLEEHQLAERDFIRQALVDGVKRFKFRVQRLQWVGWGYALESFREVLSAYMILESAYPDSIANPDAGAILKKAGAFIKSVYDKMKLVKEASELSDFALRFYGATMLAIHGSATVSGLLTHLK